ncbi:voltage-gated potassium channel [Tothia fuscella]|uniref:Voltage-gated potassium channel n=1 Tax=Tothia fuscella TaxID=1048955 RepID=A0A9P4NRF9_9PEZI|nr:voltage-gated potassium channel [Tothia fuscella]
MGGERTRSRSSVSRRRQNNDNNNQHITIQGSPSPSSLPKPKNSEDDNNDNDNGDANSGKTSHKVRKFWKFRMRAFDDDGERGWWFASTAIPLLAAAIAPLANVLSIAALVTYWRMNVDDGTGKPGPELSGKLYADPHWCYALNVVSLVCGFVGNLFLLFNFTGRVRYILALPATILLWYMATGILMAITLCMEIYVPPKRPLEVYSQGFWYAIVAAVLYCICSMLLMINMLGYFLGHYPQTFDLTDSQRTLILQTMLFFVWLAGGGAVFSSVESIYGDDPTNWGFVDGLYFCDVTILTVGFGDLFPHGDLGRGLVFPYSVGGIIMLGLVISSLAKFAGELSEDKVVKKHIDKARERTVERAVTEPDEIRRLDSRRDHIRHISDQHIQISGPMNARSQTGHAFETQNSIYDHDTHPGHRRGSSASRSVLPQIRRRATIKDVVKRKEKKLVILRDQKDRFDAMRRIQSSTTRFKRWYALTLSLTAFGILWCVGAVVFWRAEQKAQGMTYFTALYFCYVSLLTIGYGDLAPKSNAGRCFFVVWSLIAVPTMTILINDLGSTVIDSFKKGTFRFADFTILPKEGVYKEWLQANPKLWHWLLSYKEKREVKKRLKEGMRYPTTQDVDNEENREDIEALHPNFETLEKELTKDTATHKAPSDAVLARRLALAIRQVASDLKSEFASSKHYSFEEWAELTRLIRFTSKDADEAFEEEEKEGLIEWDWIGETSPMMSGQSEPEFVLDRLCESLGRYMRRVEKRREKVGFGDIRKWEERPGKWDGFHCGDGDMDGACEDDGAGGSARNLTSRDGHEDRGRKRTEREDIRRRNSG